MGKIVRNNLMGLSCALVILFGIFLVGNHYQMTEKRVTIRTTAGELSAVVTTPKKAKVKGVIVFVHGDGAQEATQNGGYKPLMERFAKEGYMSVSWDKLGVGESKGNWLAQTMADRGREVEEVIEWVKKEYPDTSSKIGLWGASQAGWVIPKVMNQRNDIQFSILAAPAINWLRQGEYDTGWQVRNNGGSEAEVKKAQGDFIADSQLIEANETYATYQKNGGTEKMSSDRYGFIRKNMKQDATKELSTMKGKVYLVVAAEDKNVDAKETEKSYRAEIPTAALDVKIIPKVGHQMLNPTIANANVLMTLAAVMMPKYLLIEKEYLDYCQEVVAKQ